jgi:hypothetical protein
MMQSGDCVASSYYEASTLLVFDRGPAFADWITFFA